MVFRVERFKPHYLEFGRFYGSPVSVKQNQNVTDFCILRTGFECSCHPKKSQRRLSSLRLLHISKTYLWAIWDFPLEKWFVSFLTLWLGTISPFPAFRNQNHLWKWSKMSFWGCDKRCEKRDQICPRRLKKVQKALRKGAHTESTSLLQLSDK